MVDVGMGWGVVSTNIILLAGIVVVIACRVRLSDGLGLCCPSFLTNRHTIEFPYL